MVSADEIQRLVTVAFTLEAISDKDECTTRYVDLPGKPLQDFLIAGINVGKHFAALARDVEREGDRVEIFRHFVPALYDANANKSSKFVNFGLLEAMFATVTARLLSDSGSDVPRWLQELFDRPIAGDVHHLLDARKLAWSTSSNDAKRNFDDSPLRHLTSLGEFYRQLIEMFGTETSNYQWGRHIADGFPVLVQTYAALQEHGDVLQAIPEIHRSLRKEFPDMKIGILADWSAAAIFLHLYDQQ
jgi:hypothetical protein